MNGFNISSASDIYYGGNLVKWVYIGNKKVWDYKTPPVYTAPTAKAGLIYNGSAQALLNAGSTSHGTIQYSSDGSTWGTSIPTSTNASNAITVYWRLVGDGRHNDVGPTEITTSISRKDLTITAKAQTITYGNSIATGTGQVTVSGLVIGDNLTSITLTASRSTAGTGTITPSAGATAKGIGNYSVTYSTGTLTINKANQTLSVSNASDLNSMSIGSSVTLSITHSPSTSAGGGAISVTSSDTSVATISNNKVTAVAAGSCTIIVTKAATDNYKGARQAYSCTVAANEGTLGTDGIWGDIDGPDWEANYEDIEGTGSDEYLEYSCELSDGGYGGFDNTIVGVYVNSYDSSGQRLLLTIMDTYNISQTNIEWDDTYNQYIVSGMIDDSSGSNVCGITVQQENTGNILDIYFRYID